MEQLAPGLKEEQDFRNHGASQAQIDEYRRGQIEEFRAAGASDEQINEYYGIKPPNTQPIKDFVTANLQAVAAANAPKEGEAPKAEKPEPTFMQTLQHAWYGLDYGLRQDNTLALLINGKEPEAVPPEYQDRAFQIASGIGSVVGDLPAMALGGALGLAGGQVVGAGVGTLAAGPLGTLPGMAIGAGVGAAGGAFAYPAAIRKLLIEQYKSGGIKSADDFYNLMAGATWEATKGFAVGVATAGAGAAVAKAAPAIAKYGAGKYTVPTAKFGAELGAMTTVGAGLEGRVPDWNDFINGGIVLAGIKGGFKAANLIADRYVRTGEHPLTIVEEANKNPKLKEELIIPNPDVPMVVSEVQAKLDHAKKIQPQTLLGEIKQGVFDEFASLKGVPELLDVKLEAKDRPFENFHAAQEWHSKASVFMEGNTLNFKTLEPNGEPWKAITADVPDLSKVKITPAEQKVLDRITLEDTSANSNTLNKMDAYLVAATALERAAKTPDKKTGVDLQAAKEVVEAGKDTLKPVVDRYRKFMHRVMDYAVDAEVLTPGAAKAMKKAHAEHAPLYRVPERNPLEGTGGEAGKPFKRFKGDEGLILSPFKSMQMNVAAMIRAAEANRAKLTLVRAIEGAKDATGVGEIIKAKPRPLEVNQQELIKYLEKQGVEVDGFIESLKIFRAELPDPRSSDITFYDKGKEKILRLRPELAEAVKALDYDPKATSMLGKMIYGSLTKSAKITQKGITSVPEFVFYNNPIRDALDAPIQTRYGGSATDVWAASIQGFKHVFKRTEQWERFKASGGFTGGWHSVQRFIETDPWKLNEQTGFMDKTWNVVKTPFEFYGRVAEALEQSHRVGEALRSGALEPGAPLSTKIQGGYDAKEVTLNFRRQGGYRALKWAAPTIPFLKVSLSGTEKLFRNFKDNPRRTMIMGTGLITIPNLLIWNQFKDDSRYKDSPEWAKVLFTIVPLDKWEPANPRDPVGDAMSRPEDLRRQLPDGSWEVNNGSVMRIPRPFGLGILFGALPTMIFDAAYRNDPGSIAGVFEQFAEGQMPGFMPPIARAIYQQSSNKNIFTGNKVVPQYLEKSLSADQHIEYTSETAKQIAKIIHHTPLHNIGPNDTKLDSPMVVDMWIREMLGTGGLYLTKILDTALHAAGVGAEKVKPANQWADTPFARAFFLRSPSPNSRQVTEFYNEFDKTEKAINSFRKSAKKGDVGRAEEIQDEYSQDLVSLKQFKEAISQMSAHIRIIYALPGEDKPGGMSKDDKRQILDQYYYGMTNVADQGLKYLKTVREQLDQKSREEFGLTRKRNVAP